MSKKSMRFISLLCAAGALLSATASVAQTLWQNTNVGMTADQIRRAQPSAQVPSRAQTLHGGAVCGLELPDYEVGSDHFRVCFFMKDGRLAQVTMTSTEPSIPAYDALSVMLRARYGNELSASSQPCARGRGLTVCTMEWLLDTGVNVSLLYSDVNGRLQILNVVYQTRLRDARDRL